MQTVIELKATLKEDFTAYPDGTVFLMHKDETYAIDRVGNGGVVVLTPFGEVTLSWSAFRWSGEDVLTDFSGLVMEAVR